MSDTSRYFFENPHGAIVRPVYVERRMKVYAVSEHEAQTISSLNAQQSSFFALASFCGTIGLSVWINAIFYTETPPAAMVAKYMGAPVALVIAAVFVYLGVVALRGRHKTWETIKNESKLP